MIRFFLAISLFTMLVFQPAKPQEYYDGFLQQVKEELLVGHTGSAITAIAEIDQALDKQLSSPDAVYLADAQTAFRRLVSHWKAVEAIYLAGVLDDDFLDHPRMIDHFNQGNESLESLLERVLLSDKPLQRAMFKSSTKSINALDYLLFADIEGSERRWQAMRVATNSMRSWLEEILAFYLSDEQFVSGGNRSLEMLINALVDSSFRLANWRTGEPAGMVDKTRGKPSVDELEYPYSGFSVDAIVAILNTHARIFELARQTGLFTEQGRNQGLTEVAFTEQKLLEARSVANHLLDRKMDPASDAFRELYEAVKGLHDAYYFLLVEALNLQGKIVDADGD